MVIRWPARANYNKRLGEKLLTRPQYSNILFHSIMCSALYKLVDLEQHKHFTTGCQFEYSRIKKWNRVDITLGFICAQHKQDLCAKLGADVYADVDFLLKFSWLGKSSEPGQRRLQHARCIQV